MSDKKRCKQKTNITIETHLDTFSRSQTPNMKWLFALVLFKFVAGFQFKTGRILPHTNGDLDLSDLNLAGPYKPGEAILACERHQFCAGFTYRGPIR